MNDTEMHNKCLAKLAGAIDLAHQAAAMLPARHRVALTPLQWAAKNLAIAYDELSRGQRIEYVRETLTENKSNPNVKKSDISLAM
jgi:hypothetical protein